MGAWRRSGIENVEDRQTREGEMWEGMENMGRGYLRRRKSEVPYNRNFRGVYISQILCIGSSLRILKPQN